MLWEPGSLHQQQLLQQAQAKPQQGPAAAHARAGHAGGATPARQGDRAGQA